jgi:hypothetical protein
MGWAYRSSLTILPTQPSFYTLSSLTPPHQAKRNNRQAKQSPTSDSSVDALKAIYQTARRNILHRMVAGSGRSQSALNFFMNETAIILSGYGYQIKGPTAETYIVCHLLCMDVMVHARTQRQQNQLIKIVCFWFYNSGLCFIEVGWVCSSSCFIEVRCVCSSSCFHLLFKSGFRFGVV